MSHQIEIENFKHFQSTVQLAADFGRGIHKSLTVVTYMTTTNEMKVEFVVKDDDIKVCATEDFEYAINKYNSIYSYIS